MPRFSSTLARGRLFFACLSVLVVLLARPRRASAEGGRPLAVAVTVEPGATCLEAAALVDNIQAWLGTDTVDADLSVDVRGSPDQPRVVTFQTLRTGHVTASRRFDPGPARCDHLHAMVGLAIAMAIKASLVEEIAGRPVEAAAPSAPPAPVSVPSPGHRWAFGAGGVGALSVLPDPAFGLDARLERGVAQSFGVRLGILGLVSPAETFDGSPGRFDAWLLALRADLCATVAFSERLRGRGCMGLAAGVIEASGYDLPSSASSTVRWVAVANGLDFLADFSKTWSVDVAVSLFLPFARNSIVVRDAAGRVLEERDLSAIGGFVALGPVYRF